MRAPRSGRRIAAVGLLLVAAAVGIAVWLLNSRAPRLEPPPSAKASTPMPEIAQPPPETAAPSPPFVAHRRKPPPAPYLPPYEKPTGPLLVDLLGRESRGKSLQFQRGFGRIVSAEGAAPIRDAIVGVPKSFASGRESEKDVLDLEDVGVVARTDGDDRFELAESVVESTMLVSAEGFGARILDRGWLGNAFDEPFVIELQPAAKFEAHVSDGVGSPRAGVEIRLIAPAYDVVPRRNLPHERILRLLVGAQRLTDENGAATFAQLPVDVSFDAELWSHQKLLVRDPSQLVLEFGKSNSKEWRLEAGVTVTGRVVDEFEHAVVGTTLWLTQRGVKNPSSALRGSFDGWFARDKIERTAITDAEGRFTIADVAPGRWWLGVAPTDWRIIHGLMVDENAIAPVAEVVEVSSETGAADILLRVHRGLYIRGTAIDCDGQPALAGVFARSNSPDSSFQANATTDERTGRFVLGPLEPGEYSVEAISTSATLDRLHHWVYGKPLRPIGPVVIAAGRSDVLLQFESGAAIEAKAVRADSGDDASAKFRLSPIENPRSVYFAGMDPSASARFDSLPPGDYALSAVTDDGLIGVVPDIHVDEGQSLENVVVRVRPGARLRLTYVGTEEEYADVEIHVGAMTLECDGIRKNTSSTFDAPAGKVTVRWAAGDDQFEETVDLSVGETRALVWPRAKEDQPADRGH